MNAPPLTVSLAFNAAACKLAEMLWYARATAYDLDVRLWSALDHPTRVLYVDQAQQILHANRPVPASQASPLFESVAEVARLQAAHIIGRITPKTEEDV